MTPDTFPTASTSFHLPGPAGALEVAVDLPDADCEARPAVAVFCHPLSTEGGSMHNKVVTMACRALRELGVATVRFNFRGVGESEGAFDNGRGETLDLIAVAEWVQQVAPERALWLGGFSFGAYVSLLGARKLPVRQMISIAPPAGRWDFSAALPPDAPWLVIQGESDDVVSPQDVYEWIDDLPEKPTLVKMPEADHFFHRRLLDLRGAIKNGVRKNLPPAADGAA
ncbi:alpha/beta hydrolase [Coralloluteibacterium stylophorae]|uniref:Alpha/beta fold hydrolase n=1 Tax=Coralloluteibacterium stylophorae TaxID=1776034 RepID=A0A8J7VQF3_9GAMM|nr:alpha/beta family hydrolase [Coralloluteibacterium stylophorae]MBS7458098.1 alpha/beta fold hydrolase [Coralloluteibacterium stylophorae]